MVQHQRIAHRWRTNVLATTPTWTRRPSSASSEHCQQPTHNVAVSTTSLNERTKRVHPSVDNPYTSGKYARSLSLVALCSLRNRVQATYLRRASHTQYMSTAASTTITTIMSGTSLPTTLTWHAPPYLQVLEHERSTSGDQGNARSRWY